MNLGRRECISIMTYKVWFDAYKDAMNLLRFIANNC